jgi:hypothetical protein
MEPPIVGFGYEPLQFRRAFELRAAARALCRASRGAAIKPRGYNPMEIVMTLCPVDPAAATRRPLAHRAGRV